MRKKKVLHVHGAMYMGGTESVIMNIYRNIDRDKFDFEFTKMVEEECPYDKEILKLGGKIEKISQRSEVGYVNHCKELYKLFKNNKYDVIHSHMNFHGGIVAILAKLASESKIICHAHNTSDDGEGIKRKIEIKILRKLINVFSDKKVACGELAGRYVFGENSTFEILNNFVDVDRFRPMKKEETIELIQKYGLENKLILGHIGRFSEQKNHKYIVKILKQLVKEEKNFKFVFIGVGELEESFKVEIRKEKLEKYVLMLGLRSDVEKWLNIFDGIVFPSLFEGLPVTLIEAQAVGVPCLISDQIDNKVDMGLDLIDYIGINQEEIFVWIEKIKKLKGRKIEDVEKIKKQLTIKKYTSEAIVNRISEIYSEE